MIYPSGTQAFVEGGFHGNAGLHCRFDIFPMRALLNLALAIVFILLAGAPALADKRIALVIGNSTYERAPKLVAPANGAVAVAAMLKSAGFDSVETMLDATDDEMGRALSAFRAKSDEADVVVVYYAGYAAQIDHSNYLIPVDGRFRRKREILNWSLPLDYVMNRAQRSRKLGLVLLDACRELPPAIGVKELRQPNGLAKVEPPRNVLISFAAQADSIASDGVSQTSPYTRALLDHLATPDVDIRVAFDRIRDDVMRATSNVQEPVLFGSLDSDKFVLAATAPAAPRQ